MAENPSDLVGQEFIFEYGVDRIMPPSEETGGVFATEQRCYRRERIVRCRNCEFYEGGGCTLLDFSATDMDLGFCKWAVPRDKE